MPTTTHQSVLSDPTGLHTFAPSADGLRITHHISAPTHPPVWQELPPALFCSDPQTRITAVAISCALGGYWLFYASRDHSGKQRILLANSADLVRFDPYHTPLIHALPPHLREQPINTITLTPADPSFILTVNTPGGSASYTSTDLLRWALVV